MYKRNHKSSRTYSYTHKKRFKTRHTYIHYTGNSYIRELAQTSSKTSLQSCYVTSLQYACVFIYWLTLCTNNCVPTPNVAVPYISIRYYGGDIVFDVIYLLIKSNIFERQNVMSTYYNTNLYNGKVVIISHYINFLPNSS